ncbi:hypothetical protein LTR66_005934 [Elasticomyces elasticus]|nr:hypothetical protein LTR66_005934 [Elasticomyces elasticus]
MTNILWQQDTTPIRRAIDRRAFDRAFTSLSSKPKLSPNLVYDRMFAFYDTDGNGVIGFEEFLNGLACLRGLVRKDFRRKVFDGYDIDGDGYVCRNDFLRMYRAKYAIHIGLATDAARLEEQIHADSSRGHFHQTISAAFTEEDVPEGSRRPSHGKSSDEYGDLQLASARSATQPDGVDDLASTRTIIEHQEDTMNSAQYRQNRRALYVDDEEDETWRNTQEAVPGVPAPRGEYSVPRVEQRLCKDILYEVAQEGMNELLHPLFKEREILAVEVWSTRQERRKLQVEIDAFIQEKQRLASDPLLATADAAAIQNFTGPSDHQAEASEVDNDTVMQDIDQDEVARNLPLDGTIVRQVLPTDPASLEVLESNIRNQPLDDLLQDAGYTIDDEATTVSAGDSTLSQNAPIDNKAKEKAKEVPQHIVKPPTTAKARLEYLVKLEEEAAEISRRGGPGRLSFAEYDRILIEDQENGGDLTPTISSWLEWAQF